MSIDRSFGSGEVGATVCPFPFRNLASKPSLYPLLSALINVELATLCSIPSSLSSYSYSSSSSAPSSNASLVEALPPLLNTISKSNLFYLFIALLILRTLLLPISRTTIYPDIVREDPAAETTEPLLIVQGPTVT